MRQEPRWAVLPGYSEFGEALRRLAESQDLRFRLGASGQAYVRRECCESLPRVLNRRGPVNRDLPAPRSSRFVRFVLEVILRPQVDLRG